MENNYRLTTKLQEGNVFTRLCLSMMGVGVYSWSQVPIREVSTQGVGMSGVSIQGGEYLGSECPGVSTWEVNYSG